MSYALNFFLSHFQLLDFQEHQPESFSQFIPSSLQLCVKYNFTEDGKGECPSALNNCHKNISRKFLSKNYHLLSSMFKSLFADLVYERYVVNTFNLMRAILRCEVYRPAKTVTGEYGSLSLSLSYFSLVTLNIVIFSLLNL